MTATKQLELSESKLGKIELHILAAVRDHKFEWHWKGIKRELKRF